MKIQTALPGLAFACAALCPGTALAQAPWTPPKGEINVSVTYQWLEADRHVFSGLTEPGLTPFEVARGVDDTSNSLDFGLVQSHVVVVDGDVGVSDRLALSGSLAFVTPRYIGAFPHPGSADNGAYHGAVQDAQVGARYMVSGDLWAVAPFTALTVPVTDYEVLAHSAQGLGLTQFEIGTSVGRIVTVGGASKGYVQGTYGYASTESPIDNVSLNRSRASLEGGYFFSRFALQGQTSWRHVHGGLEWSDVGFGRHEHFSAHDQSAATREWRYGVGVSVLVVSGLSLDVAYTDFISGANTHNARTISVGWSWGFQAFGEPELGAF